MPKEPNSAVCEALENKGPSIRQPADQFTWGIAAAEKIADVAGTWGSKWGSDSIYKERRGDQKGERERE